MKNNSITDYANYADFQYQIKNNFVTDYADYVNFKRLQYLKNSFTSDYADYADFQEYVRNIFPRLCDQIRWSWTTLTALIFYITWKIVLSWLRWLRWLRWYSTLQEKWFHHRLHPVRCYERLLLIIHSSMTAFILKGKWKIVITYYIDYPVLHTTITYTGSFSRNFSPVLNAWLAIF